MRKSFFAFCFQIMCYGLHAQYIQKLEFIPPNPTTEDSVRIFYELNFSWNGATKKSSLQYIIGDSLYYSGCYYNPGVAQAESYVIDTINFGKLNSGLHPFKFTRNIVWFPTDTFCSNIGYSVTFDTTINVSAASNVVSPSTISIGPSLHPNPTTDNFRVSTNAQSQEKFKIAVFNLHGQLIQVLFEGATDTVDKVFDISSYSPGLYFVNISSTENFVSFKLIKQ